MLKALQFAGHCRIKLNPFYTMVRVAFFSYAYNDDESFRRQRNNCKATTRIPAGCGSHAKAQNNATMIEMAKFVISYSILPLYLADYTPEGNAQLQCNV
jgi:hypothetical protein